MLNAEQQKLAEDHLDIARSVVARMSHTSPALAALDTMRADAALALCEAARRYEPGRASFRTYATRRVMGGVLDGLRSMKPGGRGLDVEVLRLKHTDNVRADDEAIGASELRGEYVGQLLGLLTDRERQVIDLLYFQHMSGVEVANRLNITQGYVSQLRSSALARMREAATDAA